MDPELFSSQYPEDRLEAETLRFLELSKNWLSEGLQKLAEKGIHVPSLPIVYDIAVAGKALGGFKSVPQIRREITDFATGRADDWKRFFQHWKIHISPTAFDQIVGIQLQQHPLNSLPPQDNDRTIYVTMKDSQLVSTMRNPLSWPTLRSTLMKALWGLVEHARGLEMPVEIKDGTERWASEHLLGGSPEPTGSDDESFFGLQHRVSARLVGEVLSTTPEPLQALLQQEIRSEIHRRYLQEIAPRIEALHQRITAEEIAGDEGLSWMKRPSFRSFRHQPSLATFCQGLRSIGYEILAQELERQPTACTSMMQYLTTAADKYMEEYRYSGEEVRERAGKMSQVLASSDLEKIEAALLAETLFLYPILMEWGILEQDGNLKFSQMDAAKIPGELLPLFEKLVAAEKMVPSEEEKNQAGAQAAAQAIRDVLTRILATEQPALQSPEEVSTAELPEYSSFEETVLTILDYWGSVKSGHFEDAKSLKEGFYGQPYEISVENVRQRIEELKALSVGLRGDKEDYLRRLEALLDHLSTPENTPEFGASEQTLRTMLHFWTLILKGGDKAEAQAFREQSEGTPHEISVENVQSRLEELKGSQDSLVGDKDEYLKKLERLLAYLELEGTEGFY